jgi:4-hydroxybenzoate polyprenyltransferase
VLGDLLAITRPRQWTKNLVVFAALIFAEDLTNLRMVGLTCVAFVALCLVAGGAYAANDVMDAERDRQHPLKRMRPVASGRLKPGAALAWGFFLVVAGIAISAALGTAFLACVVGYLVLQALYTLVLKNIAIVDILTISAGFVIRALAGAAAILVPVSPWLVLCTGLLALFLAAAKRRHEVVLLQGSSEQHRTVLREYSAELLDSFMVTLSAATIGAYSLYTFFETRAPQNSLMFTIPFVVYGVLRYQYLVLSKEGGGRPEEVLLADGPIVVDVVLWLASAIFALYFLPRFI